MINAQFNKIVKTPFDLNSSLEHPDERVLNSEHLSFLLSDRLIIDIVLHAST